MNYKGYTAKIEYDDEAGILYGRLLGIRDVVDFQANRLENVEKEFKASVNDYLAFCKKRGEKPDKPYSGKLIFRTTPETHRQLAIAAEMTGKSINQFIEEAAIHASQPQA
jgi:predicted HicB family RNase H-like nuclease